MIKEIKNAEAWNDFVLSLNPNTFLQSWEWGQVQVSMGEPVKYLGVFANGKQVGAALVITVKARRGWHYLIPHGPLFHTERATRDSLADLVNHLRQTARRDKVVALRVAPLLVVNEPNQDAFKKNGFHLAPLHVHAELTWLLDISKPESELLSSMRKTTRHAIRKAEQAGVTIEVVANPTLALQRFWPLYQKTKARHHFVPWSKQMLKAQLDLFSGSDRIYSLFARYQNADVAAAILPQYGSTVFYYHGASIPLPSSIPAAQLLQWQAILAAKKRGATRYNFWGVSPPDQPHHPFAGITTFKKGFGGHAVDHLHAQDLPLSSRYYLLWLVDTYRKIRRGF